MLNRLNILLGVITDVLLDEAGSRAKQPRSWVPAIWWLEGSSPDPRHLWAATRAKPRSRVPLGSRCWQPREGRPTLA